MQCNRGDRQGRLSYGKGETDMMDMMDMMDEMDEDILHFIQDDKS